MKKYEILGAVGLSLASAAAGVGGTLLTKFILNKKGEQIKVEVEKPAEVIEEK